MPNVFMGNTLTLLDPTSFPGSLFFPPPLAPGGGKKRDPGNEVVLERGSSSFNGIEGDSTSKCVHGFFFPSG